MTYNEKSLYEKNIMKDIAKKLKKLLNENDDEFSKSSDIDKVYSINDGDLMLMFCDGDDAPVSWSMRWVINGESLGDIFEHINALENASKYNIINKFNGDYKGEIKIVFDDLDPQDLNTYKKWKKESIIRLKHLSKIEKEARIYFKNVFAIGASGKYDFYNLMRKAEDEIYSNNLNLQ